MSDFDGVDFFENAEQMESKGPEVAPTGEYEAKIIAAEKYKSNSGNWTQKVTFQIDGGTYRDHNEWYNLWSANEDSKRIASEIFSRLALVCGYKKLPEKATDFIGKTLKVGIRQFEDNWTNSEGQAVTSLKTKILKMEASEMKPAAPGEKPPF
jgi:hypothetical protein|tara:strand:+ start:1146 stop:1604 length:459 start_codon:yes stop_codon:yes gene_type:complete